MSADLLRRAAALMREKAEAASSAVGDEWRADSPAGGLYTVWHRDDSGSLVNMFRCGPCEEWVMDEAAGHGYVGGLEEPAEHIASWHPAVALAVADWLDATAVRCDLARERGNHSWRGSRQALAVARAYLGEDA